VSLLLEGAGLALLVLSNRNGNLMASAIPDGISVGLVESDDQCRQFMTAVISGTPGLHIAFICATGRDALWNFAQHPPALFLVSLFLKDMPGTELIQRTRALWPAVAPILLVPDTCPRLLLEALEAGACAYLPKPCGADELIRAIGTVHQGGAVVSTAVAKAIVDHFRARGSVMQRLTERERGVLVCLSHGRSQQAIAAQLGIDKATVHTHVRNILAKLGAHSSAEAVAFYLNPTLPYDSKDLAIPAAAPLLLLPQNRSPRPTPPALPRFPRS